MALKVAILHKTVYKYDRKVNLSPHIFRLRPAPHSRTPIEAYSIKIRPENHFFNWQQDPFGNYLARIVFPEKTTELSVEAEIIADLKTINPTTQGITKSDALMDIRSIELLPISAKEKIKKEKLRALQSRESVDWLIKSNYGLMFHWTSESVQPGTIKNLDCPINLLW